VLPHVDNRGRVAAVLAAERQVSDEGLPADARAAPQEQPGNVCPLGYPARGPASWHRRSEFPILNQLGR
jgi:hypothetical protein